MLKKAKDLWNKPVPNPSYDPSVAKQRVLDKQIRKYSAPKGTIATFDGLPFSWDGRQFRNKDFEKAVWITYLRRLVVFAIIIAVLLGVSFLILQGLDWEAMTLAERRPYKIAARAIAVPIAIFTFMTLIPRFPPKILFETSETIVAQILTSDFEHHR